MTPFDNNACLKANRKLKLVISDTVLFKQYRWRKSEEAMFGFSAHTE